MIDPENAAAEVKVLTEAALRLGRKEALEEAVDLVDALADGVVNREKPYNEAFIHACGVIARHLASHPDATSGRTDPALPAICRRCFHTAHEDVGECRVCYCRSARTALGDPNG